MSEPADDVDTPDRALDPEDIPGRPMTAADATALLSKEIG